MEVGLKCLKEHHEAVKLLTGNIEEIVEAFDIVAEFDMVDELFNASERDIDPKLSINVICLFIALFQYHDTFEGRIYTSIEKLKMKDANLKWKKCGVLLKLLYVQVAAFSQDWAKVKQFFGQFRRTEVNRVAWMPKDLQVFTEALYLYEKALCQTIEQSFIEKKNAQFRKERDVMYVEAQKLLEQNVKDYPGDRPEQFFLAHIIRDRALAWPRPTYTLEETVRAKEIGLESMKYADIVPITKAQ